MFEKRVFPLFACVDYITKGAGAQPQFPHGRPYASPPRKPLKYAGPYGNIFLKVENGRTGPHEANSAIPPIQSIRPKRSGCSFSAGGPRVRRGAKPSCVSHGVKYRGPLTRLASPPCGGASKRIRRTLFNCAGDGPQQRNNLRRLDLCGGCTFQISILDMIRRRSRPCGEKSWSGRKILRK